MGFGDCIVVIVGRVVTDARRGHCCINNEISVFALWLYYFIQRRIDVSVGDESWKDGLAEGTHLYKEVRSLATDQHKSEL